MSPRPAFLLVFLVTACVSTRSPIIVPAEVVNARVLIECRVNGSRPLTFILDTGASESVLNSDRAAELGWALSGGERAAVEGGEIESSAVRNVSLTRRRPHAAA